MLLYFVSEAGKIYSTNDRIEGIRFEIIKKTTHYVVQLIDRKTNEVFEEYQGWVSLEELQNC